MTKGLSWQIPQTLKRGLSIHSKHLYIRWLPNNIDSTYHVLVPAGIITNRAEQHTLKRRLKAVLQQLPLFHELNKKLTLLVMLKIKPVKWGGVKQELEQLLMSIAAKG